MGFFGRYDEHCKISIWLGVMFDDGLEALDA